MLYSFSQNAQLLLRFIPQGSGSLQHLSRVNGCSGSHEREVITRQLEV
ncbi:hypothetical protein WH279_04785 [Erwinia sp. MYb375]